MSQQSNWLHDKASNGHINSTVSIGFDTAGTGYRSCTRH